MIQHERLMGARLPAGLADLDPAVEGLHIWGRLPAQPWVAVVGTRRPSAASTEFGRQLVADLVAAGVCAVSGGAKGVDATIHQAAIELGAPTVVVAPSGFERPYPAEHRALFERVVEGGGAFLSEHEGDVVARRHTFFRRNAVLVACSAAVVVVQAPLRSGARNAALWARRLGRPLFVVPHAPWEAAGAGCVEELKLGATPLTSAKQVVRALTDRGHVCFGTTRVQQRGPTLDRESPQQLGFAGLDPNTAREPAGGDARPDPVVAALDGGARSLDELHAITGVPIAQLRADLSRCVLDGRLRELEDGRYAKAELARE